MNKTVSAIGGLFVILVAVVFIMEFRPASGAGGVVSGPTCAIEIEGNCIPATHFTAAYRLVGGGFDQSYLKSMNARRLVADGLIERYLLNQDAKRLGVSVSEDEITAEIARGRAYVSLPADKEREMAYYLGLLAPSPRRAVWETPFRALPVKNPKTKVFDAKTVEKNIRSYTKLSPTDFREFEREEMIAARMRELIQARVHVSDDEGYQNYAQRKSTATISYVKLDREFYTDLLIDKSQKAVDEWAAKNADEINKTWESRKSQYEGECRVSRHVLAKFSEEASDDEKAKAKKKIDKVLELAKKGEDFGALARRFSDDEGSARRDGELGCVPRKQMVKPFEDALFALEEGKVSDVVTSQFGYHVIKLDKIAKGDAVEKAVKDQIARELYLRYAAEEKAAAAAKSIQAAVKGGKSLEDAVKAYTDELAASQSKDGEKKAEEAKPAEEPKKEGEAAADEIVENKAYTIETHPDRPIVQASAPFNASGNPIPDATSTTDLVKEVFKLQKPGETTGDVVALRSGYAVVTLKEKTPVTKEDWLKDTKEREETLGAIRKTKQIEALTLYLQRLRARAERETPIKRMEITNDPPEDKGEAPEPIEEEP